jgi:hypothetical protein
MEVDMRRIILGVSSALGAVASAQADTSTYYWQRKGQWTDARL